MTHTLDFTTSINMEEITERIDELLAELEAHHDEQETTLSFEFALQDVHNFYGLVEEWDELKALQEIADDLKGEGGDHEWKGDWYPGYLIHEDDFKSNMDEMIDDCYPQLSKNLPSWVSLNIDYDALRQDYTEHEIDGNTFLAR
ncbi:ArdA-like antrestriction protein [Stenotrophomonas phage Siara]|uniref:ArdA-like antrestriction protein n=1 Tax=Stenotrophomonas phage Siara TaxID=2859658 RepID=A0AAE8BLJ1_9CAUD|nr:ArdA-like antrestriction protein [Stenotrophomonas phage Siara]QYW02008.1 ArdA-like antrestriction protein [Stenotrophomonas phage Siara]